MTDTRTATTEQLRTAIEDIYARSDALMDSLSEADWQRKHGDDWTMSDVPYHLAYFDRELVEAPLERGRDVPEAEQLVFGTPDEIDAWNATMFAQRASDATVADDRAQLAEVRSRLLARLGAMADADLEQQVWMPLAGLGWREARTILTGCVMHNWSEHMQLRLRLGLDDFVPAPATTNVALDGFLRTMPMTMNRDAAQQPFAARFSITGPGGGDWLLQAHEGDCDVSRDADARADLTMSMSSDTFVQMANNMRNPMLLMLTRRIRLKGMTKMPKFGKIFPEPSGSTRMQADLVKM